jgi:integral membrane sensor domain MASE1
MADALAAVLLDPVIGVMLVAGLTLVVIAAFLRRHHRRRLGWGVLPARSYFARGGGDDWD